MTRFSLRPPPLTLQKRYRDAGQWLEKSFGGFIDEKLRECASLEVHFYSETDPFHGTIAEVRESALRLAGALAARGIRPGDVVSCQIPNRVEGLVVFYGCALAGVVLVPIVHFYGPKEVRFILERSGARMHLTASRFRGTDYLKALDGFRADLPNLEHVAVIGGGARPGELEFEQLLSARPLAELPRVAPADPAVIAFTSGTTADPKGVIHPSYSLVFETLQFAALNMPPRTFLTGAPVSHVMGMLGGALLPLVQGHAIHLWDPLESTCRHASLSIL